MSRRLASSIIVPVGTSRDGVRSWPMEVTTRSGPARPGRDRESTSGSRSCRPSPRRRWRFLRSRHPCCNGNPCCISMPAAPSRSAVHQSLTAVFSKRPTPEVPSSQRSRSTAASQAQTPSLTPAMVALSMMLRVPASTPHRCRSWDGGAAEGHRVAAGGNNTRGAGLVTTEQLGVLVDEVATVSHDGVGRHGDEVVGHVVAVPVQSSTRIPVVAITVEPGLPKRRCR